LIVCHTKSLPADDLMGMILRLRNSGNKSSSVLYHFYPFLLDDGVIVSSLGVGNCHLRILV